MIMNMGSADSNHNVSLSLDSAARGGSSNGSAVDSYDYYVDETWTRIHYYANPEDMLKPWKINPYFVAIVITYSVTFLIGAIGNVIIVITMTREKASRNATSMFLVSLAVADLLLLFICAPVETLHYFLVKWDHSYTLCRLGAYVKTLSAVSSVLNLTAVSFERYVVIVYPMKSRALCTMSNCRRALILVWVVAFLLSTPVVVSKAPDPITYYNNETNLTIYYCLDTEEGDGIPLILAFYQLVIMFALPLFLMTFCYARVIKELWMSTVVMSAMTKVNSSTRFDSRSSISSALRTSTGNTTSTSTSTSSFMHRHSPTRLSSHCDDVRQARKQVIKMLILVIVLFLVCWGPYLILQILLKKGLRLYTPAMYTLRVVFTLLPFIHSCLNPIIYSLMSSNFRRMMMRTCSNQTCGLRNRIGGYGGSSSWLAFLCCRGRSGSIMGGSGVGNSGLGLDSDSNVRGIGDRSSRHRCSNRATASYELGMNGDAAAATNAIANITSARRPHPRLQHTFSNTCSSDIRTSPITECESMLHDSISLT